MDILNLPEEIQKDIVDLKYTSSTIETDVLQALYEAHDLKDFQEIVKTYMDDLTDEINSAREQFCEYKIVNENLES